MPLELKEISAALASVVEGAGTAIVRVEGRRRRPSSGMILAGDGLVIAANHAVERDEEIRVSFDGEETRSAELVGRDAGTDLALLRVEGGSGSAHARSDATETRVGHLLLVL